MPLRPIEPMIWKEFDASRLMAEHPPRFRHPSKAHLCRQAFASSRPTQGKIIYTRWWPAELPQSVASTIMPIEVRPDVYDYQPTSAPPPVMEWHVNFADPHLFYAYASSLFAQDEIQVMEHPVLGSILENLHESGVDPLTVDHTGPTPVLIQGAERRLAIATDVNAAAGRPNGLYGNRFSYASLAAIDQATTIIDPPTLSNLIAIAAPTGGGGQYSADQIRHVLTTAYTGFAAAKVLSAESLGAQAKAIVHTGFWGCGAFGGNRTLMPMLQFIAASLAGIDRVIFHAFDRASQEPLERAERIAADLLRSGASIVELIESIKAMKFEWGFSDGN